MRTLLHNSTFKTRLWIGIVAIVILATWITGLSSQYLASRLLERKTAELSQMMIGKSAQALEEKLRKVRLSVLTFMMSPPFEDILRASPGTDDSYYSHFALNNALQVPLVQMQLIEPSIESALVSAPIGEFYSVTGAKRTHTAFEDTPLYRTMQEKTLPLWYPAHSDQIFESGSNVLSLLIEPISAYRGTDVKVVVNVSESAIKEYAETNVVGDSGSIVVIGAAGNPVMDGDSPFVAPTREAAFQSEVDAGRNHFEYTFDGKDYLVNWAKVTFPDNWMIFYFQPRDVLLKDIRYIRWATLVIVCALIPLALILSKWITGLLIRPLYRLQRLMARAGDSDLSVRFSSDYRDEVAQVGERFNTMLEKIEVLIQDVTDAEKQKRMSEVKALQAQIDPHFLYNTLNTILWKSESRKQEDVKEMIVSLSQLFRLGLNNGHDLTTVAKEVDHASRYLSLQQQCYEDLFTYEITVEEGLEEQPLLKILLQPLVENSILHGFQSEDYTGRIMIRVYREGTFIVCRVEDNGKGFDKETVEAGLVSAGRQEKGGYALRNVYTRLRLHYGEKAVMELESEPYRLTAVTLRFPGGNDDR
ncbi:sensor histidine kinase [Paenibacillus sp. S150]|uniref:sensor histidine kinase n=1 Tax=Paenibacillus sp. S150 TaxID=2749826 RepID=UPI001C596B31|nr:sensor histidine kinase [Paenibacillus sp. S150]MBW4079848.1 sensor histidine kinase [Paenibacillus sp. S150]